MSNKQSADGAQPVMGIGSCLAGNAVRYNKQAKSPNQHVRALSDHFEMRAFCPVMGIGMGVPRAPIHLVGLETGVRGNLPGAGAGLRQSTRVTSAPLCQSHSAKAYSPRGRIQKLNAAKSAIQGLTSRTRMATEYAANVHGRKELATA